MRLEAFVVLGVLLLASCVPAVKEDLSDVVVDLKDSTQIRVLEFQDKQWVDSLIRTLAHPDATHRYLATRAFASIRDESCIDPLIRALDDANSEVEIQAAYALGQQRSDRATEALIRRFGKDTVGQNRLLMATLLEAVGKTGTKAQLEQLATVSSYLPTDTLLVEGQMWAIYRYALRGITTEAGTKRAISVLTGPVFPRSVRFAAAHYLMRAAKIDLTPYSAVLNNALVQEKDPEILMCLARSCGKCASKTNEISLLDLYPKVSDYRVKINILRALSEKQTTPSIHALILEAVQDKNEAVALVAAEMLQKMGNTEEANEYKKWARDTTLSPLVRAALYKAAQLQLPFYYSISKGAINYDLRQWLAVEKDPYIQAALVSALAADPTNYPELLERLKHEHPYARTSAARDLLGILDHKEFDQVLKSGWNQTRKKWLETIEKVMKQGDAGVVAELSTLITHPQLQTDDPKEWDYLDTVLLSLTLPEHGETYNMLSEAIGKVNGNASRLKKAPVFLGHPPNWSAFKTWPDSLVAKIETSRGTFVIGFFVEETPATVLNFIDLADRGYFNGKNFHRVVPNFVIQGGCSRGDGYGSLNYNIRSELTPKCRYHSAGMVGMASAGEHTESTQWFVTHSATPHLDGRYTLFGKVLEGMEVVHRIQQNDIIQEVKIIRFD